GDHVPEDGVAVHERVERGGQGGGVQVALDPVRPGKGVGGVAGVELVDDPEPPLGRGERGAGGRVGGRDGGRAGVRGGGAAAAEQAGLERGPLVGSERGQAVADAHRSSCTRSCSSACSRTARACCSTVVASKQRRSGSSTPSSSWMRVMRRTASREWPPSAKKSSAAPTRSRPSRPAQMPAITCSTGVRGATKAGAGSGCGGGSALRSSLPLGRNGKLSTGTNAAGIIASGRRPLRYARSVPASA